MNAMAQIKEKTKIKRPGFFQWLLVIIVPLLFAIVITFIVLSFMGIDVLAKSKEIANQIPFLSKVVTTEEEAGQEREQAKYENQLTEKDQEIEDLTAEVSSQEQTIDDLNQEIVKLTNQLEDEESNESSEEQLSEDENLQKLTKSYEEMDPEKAAPILANVEQALATNILREMKDDSRGAILSAMEAETAATLTQALAE